LNGKHATKELQPTTPTGYAELLRELKQKIRSAQLRASVAVNQELVLLYWRIGREIPVRQERESRGCDGIKRDLAGLNLGGQAPRRVIYA
jgi:hypothetical protein